MKKLLIITGSYPPDICGVGDYISCLMKTVKAKKWVLYYSPEWSIGTFNKKRKEINDFSSEYLCFQYPTQGYGWSILPQLICIYYSFLTRKKVIVVLHEFSQRKLKAKIATTLFFCAKRIVFTNEFEKAYALRLFPFLRKRFCLIKIFSNIKPSETIQTYSEREYDLGYFGHIRPSKGIEDFLATALMCLKKKKLRVAIIGQILPEYKEYYNDLCVKYNMSLIDFHLNESVTAVSSLLNNIKFTFLPFPDGISERRGSFLAAISNGSCVVTYRGKYVTPALSSNCYFTTSISACYDILMMIDTMDDVSYRQKQLDNMHFLKAEFPNSWEEVALLYEKVKETI